MKVRTTITTVIAAVALSVAISAIITPRAVKAAIATLIRDQDNAARRPFTTSCQFNPPSVSCTPPSIPTGEVVVIETVSVSAVSGPGNGSLEVQLQTQAGGGFLNDYVFSTADNGRLQPQFSRYAVTQPIRLYADPGTAIICGTSFVGGNSNTTVTCLFSGFSVSLP
jgi:hypothetical protein